MRAADEYARRLRVRRAYSHPRVSNVVIYRRTALSTAHKSPRSSGRRRRCRTPGKIPRQVRWSSRVSDPFGSRDPRTAALTSFDVSSGRLFRFRERRGPSGPQQRFAIDRSRIVITGHGRTVTRVGNRTHAHTPNIRYVYARNRHTRIDVP